MCSLPLATADEVGFVRHSDGASPPRRGVLLISLGTPEGADVRSVRRYLAEFLADPEVIRLPRGLGWLNRPLASMIALRRAPHSAKMYRSIWTAHGSPLRTIVADQACALEQVLARGWRVFYAMRYGKPSIGEALKAIVASGIEELVVVPLYPQFSGPTTRTALRALYGHLESSNQQIQVTTRPLWHNDAGYIHAQAALIEEHARAENLTPQDTYLLFSAHSLPTIYVKRGDPCPGLVEETVRLVVQRLGWPADRFSLAYQSRFGPMSWVGPHTDEVLGQLAADGEKQVLVCPVSFTTDCLETLEEIGVRYRSQFEKTGGKLHLCPALNTYGPFMSALKDLVLRGTKPVTRWGNGMRPLMGRGTSLSKHNGDVAGLVMIGASVGNRIGPGQGPPIAYTGDEVLRGVKRSQCDVPDLLREVCEQVDVHESWLWNTCKRFEFYGYVDDPADTAGRAKIIDRLRRHLFGDQEPEDLGINVLFGGDVLHHLLRTAAGLNSGLPGERDIIDQLQAAHRLARCAGTAGLPAERLLEDVLQFEQDLRLRTKWGRFEPNYCYTAISRVVEPAQLDLSKCRVVVIGGSTTSASVLRTLIDRFDVPSEQLTLLYRGHKRGGQIKLLRKAIGNGRRLRVQSYSEPAVIRAIAEADVVFFGIDREEPVLDAGQLGRARDFTARPLAIVDFNIFGSTSGVETMEGVTLYTADRLEVEVAAFAEEMCAEDEFKTARQEAEQRICEHVRSTGATRRCDALVAKITREAAAGFVPAFLYPEARGRIRPAGDLPDGGRAVLGSISS